MGKYTDTLISEYDIDEIVYQKESDERSLRQHIKEIKDHINYINSLFNPQNEEDLRNMVIASTVSFNQDTKSSLDDYLSLEYFELFKPGSKFLPENTDYYISEIIDYSIKMPTYNNDLYVPIITSIRVKNTKNSNGKCDPIDFFEEEDILYPCNNLKLDRFFYKSTRHEEAAQWLKDNYGKYNK
jgi:hypothetical protein